MKAFLLSRRALAISKVRSDFDAGLAMDPAPYGIKLEADNSDPKITYSDGYAESTLASYFTWQRFGIDIPHALRNLNRMRKADIIWTVLDWEWLAASFLQKIGLLQTKPIIANCVFLAENYSKERRSRRLLWPWLMTSQVFLTMHSRRAIDSMSPLFPSKTFHLLPFGISTRAFPLTPPRPPIEAQRPIRVYSIGDDPCRDWACMLAAFGNDDRFEIKIVCRWLGDETLLDYDNLEIPRNVTVADQRALYEWSDIVVVAMRENLYSGITVMCEAASMGKPVIVSRTGGAETYFSEDEVIYVAPSEPDAMKHAALSTNPNRLYKYAIAAQERFVASDYSAAGMVRRYIDLSRTLLAAKAFG